MKLGRATITCLTKAKRKVKNALGKAKLKALRWLHNIHKKKTQSSTEQSLNQPSEIHEIHLTSVLLTSSVDEKNLDSPFATVRNFKRRIFNFINDSIYSISFFNCFIRCACENPIMLFIVLSLGSNFLLLFFRASYSVASSCYC